ncbi:hypothetical protein [Haladaptatus cibarius]|uniref:hypothetical protein n=1 Tax=Haladaptatus cibarius TaxID=453847 RepID=UPI000A7809ED|nr:hypothetical protein [Haladaptatus cibarius]
MELERLSVLLVQLLRECEIAELSRSVTDIAREEDCQRPRQIDADAGFRPS